MVEESTRDRVARRIYEATPGAENDPWTDALRRRTDFGLAGHTVAVTTAYAQADAALDEMRLADRPTKRTIADLKNEAERNRRYRLPL